MGRHESKDKNPNPLNTKAYKPQHAAKENDKPAGSDLPARDVGVKSTIIKRFKK